MLVISAPVRSFALRSLQEVVVGRNFEVMLDVVALRLDPQILFDDVTKKLVWEPALVETLFVIGARAVKLHVTQ